MSDSYTFTGPSGPVSFICAALLSSCLLCGPARSQSLLLLPTTELTVGAQPVQAEIAATEASREQGLMYRQSLLPDHGMLFVFERAEQQCFWMKNTLLPLSIAFIAANGKILNIADMQPQTEDAHCPSGPILYALEMQQGWFAEHRIQAGQAVLGLPKKP
ncbi:DUF192 domain-containing protein [Paralcaligenes sp. KSB-10]|jgi:uncharacterized membrane protein (UPF0127 family)|uniref:DUF192 domain-containing protein n=1 Tax=Paralcaligenes sp. KSB-10 TaxID=2901142 RepID=UPI001E5D0A1B|nr:DUF192 domain-containing protein [Paralcaligenes sp. KSB-10]UHL64501.1 DUF192 domain-containing protein [Paralcaligenes sp. KSB-10]